MGIMMTYLLFLCLHIDPHLGELFAHSYMVLAIINCKQVPVCIHNQRQYWANMRTYLAVFNVLGCMSCFFIFMLVVKPTTGPAAISKIPLQGSGVSMWEVGKVDLGALSLRGVQANL